MGNQAPKVQFTPQDVQRVSVLNKAREDEKRRMEQEMQDARQAELDQQNCNTLVQLFNQACAVNKDPNQVELVIDKEFQKNKNVMNCFYKEIGRNGFGVKTVQFTEYDEDYGAPYTYDMHQMTVGW